ncbi:hypothetical protein C5167_023707 [Papaver somniferum]|uniref:Uncharacterized protein n=1 Tax=Papaver somniferum TaxID=3469 RepID=A0A4Y7JN16_PAPSO|nr:hypothetical protein C5167_023707 [Papaver somniferum]
MPLPTIFVSFRTSDGRQQACKKLGILQLCIFEVADFQLTDPFLVLGSCHTSSSSYHLSVLPNSSEATRLPQTELDFSISKSLDSNYDL